MKKNQYPDYKSASGWNKLLPKKSSNPQLNGNISSDVVVIGAGFTGVAAAKRWYEIAPQNEIIMIDASTAGEGSSGRNSGFLVEIALANDISSSAAKKLMQCNKLISDTLVKIQEDASKSSIDCQIQKTGVFRVAASAIGVKSLNKYIKFLESTNLDFELFNNKELHETLGTKYYQQGLYTPHCFLAQPAALIRALVENLPSSISYYENTPALKCLKSKSKWIIKTPNGEIKTKKVIIANNAFCGKLGIGNAYLATIYTYAGLTEQLSQKNQELLGNNNNWGILPTHRLGSTLRRTLDGRLMIRSLYHYENEGNKDLVATQLLDQLRKRYPQFPKLNFETVWGGATGLTLNGSWLWGEYDKNLYISAGCNGGGIVKGTLFGEHLANLANDKPTPDIKNLFGSANWMPPEPFRKIGFNLISMIESHRGKAEI
ncbi:MAG: FAD-binding oxidoreductase [Woeseiaceae bacterium]|nr:FAD-binding oxidoreductase [Woeseiaceae bacterium]